ncbi:MAG: hypothetical protein E4H00_08355 [Myxococcales bacterium]|nr:MAG: hypothetical protein E4H00_08355 [Myxococcales bacterium]
MSRDSIPEVRAALDRKREGRRRRVAALVLCLAGVVGYAIRLDYSYAIEDWLFWKIAVLWLYGAFLAAACASCGFALLSRLRTPGTLPFVETLTTSAGVGLVGFTFGMYFGGALGLYGPPSSTRSTNSWPTAYSTACSPKWRSASAIP